MEWIFRSIGIGVTIATLIILIILFPIIGIGIGVTVAALIILFPLAVWYVLAPSNRFFTFITEGTAKIIMKAGEFNKILIQWKDHTFDQRWNVIEGKEPWHPFGGLRFYGFWPLWNIYIYRLRWTSVRQDGSSSPHDEVLDVVLLKDHLYLVKIERAEDKDMVPLDVDLLLTMRVVNPYKAIFRVQDWIEMVLGRMKPLFRQYVAENTFKQLVERKQVAGGELWKRLQATGEVDLFRNEYGIEIREGGIEMKDITPPAKYQEAATKQYLAEREKERITVEAEAEATRLGTVYQRIQDFGDLGKLVRTLEAMETSPEKGSKWVIPLPGMAELLREVFGRPPETVTREEFRELREMIEEIRKRQEGGQSS